MPPANDAVFALRAAGRAFGGNRALAGLTFDVHPGEQIALVGPSGAGKTTLIRLLNGSLLPTEGTIRLLGEDPAQLSPAALRAVQRRIGTVYQQFELVSSLRVVHNVNAGRLGEWPVGKAALSLLWPQEVEAAAGALARVGIPEKLYERTDELSGGQQQRVAIARVLAQNPDVILADEPVSNLDPAHSLAIMDLLRDLSAEMGKTLVVSLHTVAYAFSHCDRVIGLRGGRLAFDAPSGAVTQPMIDDLYQVEAGP
jgi:phosphonate transport system ATP-binding protein